MSKMIAIMSGISGSGKSAYANSIEEYHQTVSADDYFWLEGEYHFDVHRLADAHALCFRTFVNHLMVGVPMVVVDNTNTTAVEMAPYVLGAQAYGYQVEFITFICRNKWEVMQCAERNRHQVPMDGVMRQHQRLQSRIFPAAWKDYTLVTIRPSFGSPLAAMEE